MNTQLQTQVKPKTTPQPVSAHVPSGMLQRKCACGNHTPAGGECEECRKKHTETALVGTQSLQRATLSTRARGTLGDGEVPANVHDAVRSPGQPLDPATRVFMESRFDYDFRQVRVYLDAKAAESTRAVNALVLKMLWGRKLVCRWKQSAGNSLSQSPRLCVRDSA
jgi:hypothetical protein